MLGHTERADCRAKAMGKARQEYARSADYPLRKHGREAGIASWAARFAFG